MIIVKRLYFLNNLQKGLVVTFKILIIFSCEWNFLVPMTVFCYDLATCLSSHSPFLVRRTCDVLGRVWKPVILESCSCITEDPWAHLETVLHLFVFLRKEVRGERRLGRGFASQVHPISDRPEAVRRL